MAETLLFLATGAVAGLSAGLLGVGGGLIIVPMLFFVFSQQSIAAPYVMHMALATSLATIAVTSMSSGWAHHRRGAVAWSRVRQLTPGILLGAWLGGYAAGAMDSGVLRLVFGAFEFAVGVHMLTTKTSRDVRSELTAVRGFAGGGIIGAISAIVGIGGGTLTVPFLHWHGIDIKNAVATSAVCGFPIAVAGTAAYIYSGWNVTGLPSNTLGFVNLNAFAVIIITSLLAAPLGAALAHRLSAKRLKQVFAVVLLLIAAKMLLG